MRVRADLEPEYEKASCLRKGTGKSGGPGTVTGEVYDESSKDAKASNAAPAEPFPRDRGISSSREALSRDCLRSPNFVQLGK